MTGWYFGAGSHVFPLGVGPEGKSVARAGCEGSHRAANESVGSRFHVARTTGRVEATGPHHERGSGMAPDDMKEMKGVQP